MIHFDAVDISECHSEEDFKKWCFFWRSVYTCTEKRDFVQTFDLHVGDIQLYVSLTLGKVERIYKRLICLFQCSAWINHNYSGTSV